MTDEMKIEYDKQQAARKRKESIEEAMQVLMNNVNIMGSEKELAEIIIDVMNRTHRTLQQGFFGAVIMPLIYNWDVAYQRDNFDLRNEHTVTTCASLAKVLHERGNPPLV